MAHVQPSPSPSAEARWLPESRSAATAAVPPPAPSASSRYYVGVGAPGSLVSGVDAATLTHTRAFLLLQIGRIDGVAVAPALESSAAATRVIQRGRLTGYFVDASITSVEQTPAGLRVVVSVIVGTYPTRDMRAMLHGAATVTRGSGPRARRLALEGALRSAIRRLPQAMEAASSR